MVILSEVLDERTDEEDADDTQENQDWHRVVRDELIHRSLLLRFIYDDTLDFGEDHFFCFLNGG